MVAVAVHGGAEVFTIHLARTATVADAKDAIRKEKGYRKASQKLLVAGHDEPLPQSISLHDKFAASQEWVLYLILQADQLATVLLAIVGMQGPDDMQGVPDCHLRSRKGWGQVTTEMSDGEVAGLELQGVTIVDEELVELDISSSSTTALPDSIGELQELQCLVLSCCPLKGALTCLVSD